jgi:hypothetical protein
MSRGKYLHHVTLTTGDTRRSYRDEVSDDAIAWARSVWNIMTHPGKRLGLDPMPGYWIYGEMPNSKSLRCEITKGKPLEPTPIVTFGIAAHSRAGAKLWRDLIETATTPVVAIDCPPEPWIAARIELGAAKAEEESMIMIGDLERVIGWHFLEMIAKTPGNNP